MTDVYSTEEEVPYKGRGRKPLPKKVIDPDLKYAQIVKERQNGKVVSISTRIMLGNELQILEILDKSERCKTISTSFVESRNGAYRKDNKRQTRKTNRTADAVSFKKDRASRCSRNIFEKYLQYDQRKRKI